MESVEALKSTLLNLEKPIPIDHLVEMIQVEFIDNYFSIDKDDVTREFIHSIVNQNKNTIDNYYEIISLSDQEYENIQNITEEISDAVNRNFSDQEIEVFLIVLHLVRYESIRSSLGLLDIGLRKFLEDIYRDPEKITSNRITNALKTFDKRHTYNYKETKSEFDFFNKKGFDADIFSEFILKSAKIIRNYDWRITKISVYDFRELCIEIGDPLRHRSFKEDGSRFQYLGNLIRGVILKQNPNKAALFNLEDEFLIPILYKDKREDTTLEFDLNDQKNRCRIGLEMAVLGETKVELSSSIFRNFDRKDLDLLFLKPPFQKMSKSDWKEFPGLEVAELSSLEELYVRLAEKRLKESGTAVFILPDNFMSSKNKSILALKKMWIENKKLEGIIRLPNHIMNDQNGRPLNAVIINNGKVKKPLIIDSNQLLFHLNVNRDDKLHDVINFEDQLDYAFDSIIEEKELDHVSRFVNWKEILNNDFNLEVKNYINPKVYSHSHLRSVSEEILKLSEFTNTIKGEKEDVGWIPNIVSAADLPSDSNQFILDLTKLTTKSKFISKLQLLKEDAILLGKIGGSLKPTLFKFENTPVFVDSDILALRVNEEKVDSEYLISELNSEFVHKQLNILPLERPTANTKTSDLLDLCVRLPKLDSQKDLFVRWINDIAKEKIKEIERLHESIKYIEKDVFSSFAHDFGKLLLKVSSNIDAIDQYLRNLEKQEIIKLSDSIFGEKDAERGQSVGDLLTRTKSNQNQVLDFLKNEVVTFTGEKTNFEIFDLGKLIFQWMSRQDLDGYNIFLSEKDSLSNVETTEELSQSYKVYGSKNQVLKILNNFLDNAINHGFSEKKETYEFRLHLEKRSYDYNRLQQVSLHIANNGLPFPQDFTCEDFFIRKHAGPNSKGEGLGGYSIKRTVQNMGAEIRCSSSFLTRKQFPIRFQIIFKKIEL